MGKRQLWQIEGVIIYSHIMLLCDDILLTLIVEVYVEGKIECERLRIKYLMVPHIFNNMGIKSYRNLSIWVLIGKHVELPPINKKIKHQK